MQARMAWQLHRRSSLAPRGDGFSASALLLGLAAVLLTAWLLYRHVLQPPWAAALPAVLGDALTLLEGAAAVTLLVLAGLLAWQRLRAPRQALTVDDLYALSPAAFERYVAGLFRRRGYKVRVRGGSGDHGVDLELSRGDGRRAIVQCKRYRNTIGPDVVRELLGTMIHEQVQHAFLVTTADISPSAREWAQTKPMTLIDGKALVALAKALNENSRGRR